jgi:hypothetical protein
MLQTQEREAKKFLALQQQTNHNPDNSHSLNLPRRIIIITMEVASPLPFGHSATGNKRQFSGSPGLVDSTNRSPFTMHMEASDEYVNPRFKRRRFTADDTMTDSDSATVQASFPSFPSSAIQQKSSFSGASGESIVVNFLVSTAFGDIFVGRRFDVFNVLILSGCLCFLLHPTDPLLRDWIYVSQLLSMSFCFAVRVVYRGRPFCFAVRVVCRGRP